MRQAATGVACWVACPSQHSRARRRMRASLPLQAPQQAWWAWRQLGMRQPGARKSSPSCLVAPHSAAGCHRLAGGTLGALAQTHLSPAAARRWRVCHVVAEAAAVAQGAAAGHKVLTRDAVSRVVGGRGEWRRRARLGGGRRAAAIAIALRCSMANDAAPGPRLTGAVGTTCGPPQHVTCSNVTGCSPYRCLPRPGARVTGQRSGKGRGPSLGSHGADAGLQIAIPGGL